MVKVVGRRLVVFEGDKMNVGVMKGFTEKATMHVHGLDNEITYFKSQFQVLLICNQFPKLPTDGVGTWRRVRKNIFDYKLDEKDSKNNINEWKVPFISLLIHYYNKYKSVPIVV
jgi:hypothetical protein